MADFKEILNESVNLDVDIEIPALRLKFADDELRVKGHGSFPYEVFTRYVYDSDGRIKPKYWGSSKKYDREIDMVALLSAGAAEMLTCYVFDGCPVCLGFLRDIRNYIAVDVYKVIDWARQLDSILFKDSVREKYTYAAPMLNMRYAHTHAGTYMARHITQLLLCCYEMDKPLYFETIFAIMQYCYTFCMVFSSSKDENMEYYTNDGNGYNRDNRSQVDWLGEGGAVEYEINGVSHNITDSRSASIAIFLILLNNFFRTFGVVLNPKECLDIGDERYEVNLSYLQKRLNNSVGDDYIGLYLQGKTPKCRISTDKEVLFPTCSGWYPVWGTKKYTFDSRTISREEYEENILYAKANNIENLDLFGHYGVNMHYVRVDELAGIGSNLLSGKDELPIGLPIKDLINQYAQQKISYQISDMKTQYENKITDLERKLADSQVKNDKAVEDLEKTVVSLKEVLSRKTDIISNLTNEVDNLRGELSRVFTDMEMDELQDVENTVSIADMLDVLNDFKFCMVGGFNGLEARLKQEGWHNFFNVQTETEFNGYAPTCDFAVIHTKFVSHKVVYRVNERYKNGSDMLIYYNGTNIENLIKTCYEFVLNYIG